MAGSTASKKHKAAHPAETFSSNADKSMFNDDGTWEWPGAFPVYGEVLSRMRKNPQPAIFFVVLYVVAVMLSTLLQHKFVTSVGYKPYEDVFQLVFLLVLPAYGLTLADGKQVTISQATQFNVRKFIYMLGASLLFGICVTFSILLLIVPVIWTVGWFSLYQFPIIDHGRNPVQALKESKRLSENYKSRVWGVVGASIVWSLPAIALLYIPYVGSAYSMFVIVLTYGAYAMLYRNLQQTGGAEATD